MVSYETFAADDTKWDNSHLRAVELRMIQALQSAQSQAANTILAQTSWWTDSQDSLDTLSMIRNSLPENSSYPTAKVVQDHNEAVINWVATSNVFNDDDLKAAGTTVKEIIDAAITVPGDLVRGVGATAGNIASGLGNGVSDIVGGFFKSLSPLVWVVLGLAGLAALVYFFPGVLKFGRA